MRPLHVADPSGRHVHVTRVGPAVARECECESDSFDTSEFMSLMLGDDSSGGPRGSDRSPGVRLLQYMYIVVSTAASARPAGSAGSGGGLATASIYMLTATRVSMLPGNFESKVSRSLDVSLLWSACGDNYIGPLRAAYRFGWTSDTHEQAGALRSLIPSFAEIAFGKAEDLCRRNVGFILRSLIKADELRFRVVDEHPIPLTMRWGMIFSIVVQFGYSHVEVHGWSHPSVVEQFDY